MNEILRLDNVTLTIDNKEIVREMGLTNKDKIFSLIKKGI